LLPKRIHLQVVWYFLVPHVPQLARVRIDNVHKLLERYLPLLPFLLFLFCGQDIARRPCPVLPLRVLLPRLHIRLQAPDLSHLGSGVARGTQNPSGFIRLGGPGFFVVLVITAHVAVVVSTAGFVSTTTLAGFSVRLVVAVAVAPAPATSIIGFALVLLSVAAAVVLGEITADLPMTRRTAGNNATATSGSSVLPALPSCRPEFVRQRLECSHGSSMLWIGRSMADG
jgi:hypothetical protein